MTTVRCYDDVAVLMSLRSPSCTSITQDLPRIRPHCFVIAWENAVAAECNYTRQWG